MRLGLRIASLGLFTALFACGIRGNPRPPGQPAPPPSQPVPNTIPPTESPTSRGPFNPAGPPPDAGAVGSADAGT
jgi:hypothetical protein